MKLLASLACLATLIAGSTASRLQDATMYFRPEPVEDRGAPDTDADQDLVGTDAEPVFANFEGYSTDKDDAITANTTKTTSGLTFRDLDRDQEDRQLLVAETVLAFQIAAAAAPIVAELIKSSKKECQQLACWIATDSRTCAISVAERVQSEITKGRDRYLFGTFAPGGVWVRYWRTQFEPVDRGDIGTGTCTNGIAFTVTNCQSTGRVHC